MKNILILEDEITIRTALEVLIKAIQEDILVFTAEDSEAALQLAIDHVIDIFILDIAVPKFSGYVLAERLRKMDLYVMTPIVFITSIAEKELPSYRELHSYKFLCKPFQEEELIQVIKPLLSYNISKINTATKNILNLEKRGETVLIAMDCILYIEVRSKTVTFYCTDGPMEVTSTTLKAFLPKLSEKFIRCHNSYVVNGDYIKKVDKKKPSIIVSYKDFAKEIDLGRKYKYDVIKRILGK